MQCAGKQLPPRECKNLCANLAQYCQINRHKWAGPFMQPVGVEGLGYVIEKPMDFSTVKSKMEAKMICSLLRRLHMQKWLGSLSLELDDVDTHLEEFRELVLQNCRKMSTEETKRLGAALTQLSSEDLNKALLIVAQNNLNFQAAADEVFLDMDFSEFIDIMG
ncbi:hypothetical protein ACH5RR_004651 [Cinchona calisaya]|uniref:NET domain-containing protein n=1 Tax=Cinchona calisaya TaxID=153742 RepID=A0ABD3AY83_9GENT